MGANRRYGDRADAQISRRIEEIADRQAPAGLTVAELQKDRYPVVMPPTPVPVRAWVRFPSTSAQLDGHAIAWTPKAVFFEWSEYGRTTRVWVWASAVERREI